MFLVIITTNVFCYDVGSNAWSWRNPREVLTVWNAFGWGSQNPESEEPVSQADIFDSPRRFTNRGLTLLRQGPALSDHEWRTEGGKTQHCCKVDVEALRLQDYAYV